MSTNIIKLAQLNEHLKCLKSWKAQVDSDVERFQNEMLQAAANSVKLSGAIKDLEEQIERIR